MLNVVMLNDIKLTAIMLSVIIVSVMLPLASPLSAKVYFQMFLLLYEGSQQVFKCD